MTGAYIDIPPLAALALVFLCVLLNACTPVCNTENATMRDLTRNKNWN